MRGKKIMSATAAGLSAYLGKRVMRTSTNWAIANMENILVGLVMDRVDLSYSSVDRVVKYAIAHSVVPECVIYWKYAGNRTSKVLTSDGIISTGTYPPQCIPFMLDGILCIYTGNNGHRLYFQKRHKHHIYDRLQQFVGWVRSNTSSSDVYYYGSSGWIRTNIRKRYCLDTMPIHSETRAVINAHIKKISDEWDAGNRQYHRNLFFYGERGGGKSTIAAALAMELEALRFSFPIMDTSEDFMGAMERMSPHSVCVLDEMQSLSICRPDYVPEILSGMSTRDILAVLDGQMSPEGTCFIGITNDITQIDERITRDGRFHDRILVPEVDEAGIRYWLKNVYDYEPPESLRMRSATCGDLYTLIDKLDGPEALCEALKLPPKRIRKRPAKSVE